MFRFLKKKIRFGHNEPLTRKQWLIRFGSAITVLILGAAATVAALRYRPDEQVTIDQQTSDVSAQPAVITTTKPITTVASPLDGTQVTPEVAVHRPLGIMIENHPDARPQFGLSQASIVYEAVTEGGITRFLAIFGSEGGSKIGPVRSARPYYLGWVLEYDAGYGHVGGSSLALQNIKEFHLNDLDQFAVGSLAYRRELTANKALEHTMFTDTAKLRQVAENKFGNDITPLAIKFKTPLTREHRGASQAITIDFSSPSYKVTWNFDPETNHYLRSQAGGFHKDAATGETIVADTIIVQAVKRTSVDSMTTVGSGQAQVFMDGKRIEATWKKSSLASTTIFSDSTGAEIARNPGHTWIEIVDPVMNVKVSE